MIQKVAVAGVGRVLDGYKKNNVDDSKSGSSWGLWKNEHTGGCIQMAIFESNQKCS